MASDPKMKVEKLVGVSSSAKWKWQMNIHFEQYDRMSIIDGSRKCPNRMKNEKASEDDKNICWRGSGIMPGRRR